MISISFVSLYMIPLLFSFIEIEYRHVQRVTIQTLTYFSCKGKLPDTVSWLRNFPACAGAAARPELQGASDAERLASAAAVIAALNRFKS